MQRASLMMVHDLSNIPSFSLPEPYKIRNFMTGEEEKWATILTEASEFPSLKAGLERFEQEFAPFLTEVSHRMFFIEDSDGNPIGTATAWFGELDGEEMGRIHWVGIVPKHQGKKLAKPLLTYLLHHLASLHDKVYLKTQTTNLKAINTYLKLGFIPVINGTEGQVLRCTPKVRVKKSILLGCLHWL